MKPPANGDYFFFSDEILFQKLRLGEQWAFRDIYTLYASELYQYVFRKTGKQVVSETILTKIFVTLWNDREIYTTSSLKQKLYSITRMEVLRYIRDFDPDEFRKYLRKNGFL